MPNHNRPDPLQDQPPDDPPASPEASSNPASEATPAEMPKAQPHESKRSEKGQTNQLLRQEVESLKAELLKKDRQFEDELLAKDKEFKRQLGEAETRVLEQKENSEKWLKELQEQSETRVLELEEQLFNTRATLEGERRRQSVIEQHMDNDVQLESARRKSFEEKIDYEKLKTDATVVHNTALSLNATLNRIAKKSIEPCDFSEGQKERLYNDVADILQGAVARAGEYRETGKALKTKVTSEARAQRSADEELFIQNMYQKLVQWRLLSCDVNEVDRVLQKLVENVDVTDHCRAKRHSEEIATAHSEGVLEGIRESEFTRNLVEAVRSGIVEVDDPRAEYLRDREHKKHPENRGRQVARLQAPSIVYRKHGKPDLDTRMIKKGVTWVQLADPLDEMRHGTFWGGVDSEIRKVIKECEDVIKAAQDAEAKQQKDRENFRKQAEAHAARVAKGKASKASASKITDPGSPAEPWGAYSGDGGPWGAAADQGASKGAGSAK